MTTIVFHRKDGSPEITLETCTKVKIVGSALSVGGPVLAIFQGGAWYLGSAELDRVSWKGRIRLDFQEGTHFLPCGPVNDLTLAGALVMTASRTLAGYDAFREVWRFGEHETDAVIVTDDSARQRDGARRLMSSPSLSKHGRQPTGCAVRTSAV